MQNLDGSAVLRRKVRARAEPKELTAMTPARALRFALPRAGDAALGCPVALKDLEEGQLKPDELATVLPDPALIVQLDGAGGEKGLAVVCPQVMGAVIEALTTGRVLRREAAERRPTPTDAVMIAEFLNSLVAFLRGLAGEFVGPTPFSDYALGRQLSDPRAAIMVLRDVPHGHYRLTLDLGAGAKTGMLDLVLPDRAASQEQPAVSRQRWQSALRGAVMQSHAPLDVILCRFSLPISQVSRVAAGDILALPNATVDTVSMEGARGFQLVPASLGRSGPMRAVRIARSVDAGATPATASAQPDEILVATGGPPKLAITGE